MIIVYDRDSQNVAYFKTKDVMCDYLLEKYCKFDKYTPLILKRLSKKELMNMRKKELMNMRLDDINFLFNCALTIKIEAVAEGELFQL